MSGTAEEIQRDHEAGKPVHVYFSTEPLPRDVDIEQLTALRDFKASLQSQGLLGSYADPTDLGYHVRNAVEQDLAVLNLGVVIARPVAEEHAILRTEYKFEREGTQDRNGRIRMRTIRERLEVTNRGAVTAEGVGIELQAVGDGEPPHLHSVDIKPDIIPQSHCDFPVLMSLSTGGAFKVALTWREGEEQHAETQTLIG